MLRFPYLEEPLLGPPPPSLPAASTARWRPLVPLTVHGPTGGAVSFSRALVDPGADDTVLPLDVAHVLGVPLLAGAGFAMRWRGQRHSLQYGQVDLELVDDQGNSLRWCATVAFAAISMRYPLLGMAGCLNYIDAHFLGTQQVLELEGNSTLVAVAQP